MRVVLDTNVIVSGLNFPGNERLVLELALRALGDAATVIEPLRLPGVIEDDHADNRILDCAVGRPPTTWRLVTVGICCR